MIQYEYKVLPTPRRPRKSKGVKGEPARFASVLTDEMNTAAVGGWEFYRTEVLPMDAKPGRFKSRVEVHQSVMVFRRVIEDETTADLPESPGVLTSLTRDAHVERAPLSAHREELLPAAAAGTMAAIPAVDGGYSRPEAEASYEAEAEAEPAPIYEAPEEEDAVEASSATEFKFDENDMDPLKKVVEANRNG